MSSNSFYMYFGTLEEFLEFYIENGNQKMENPGIVPGRFLARGLTARPAQRRHSPRRRCHALGTVTVRRARLGRRGGTSAAGGKVLPMSLRGPRGLAPGKVEEGGAPPNGAAPVKGAVFLVMRRLW
jgi:hypothetical protein